MPRGPSILHLLADCAAVLLAFWLAFWLRFSSGLIPAPLGQISPAQWWLLAGISTALWLLILALHGAYYARLKQSFAAELGAVTSSVAQGFVATIVLTFSLRGLPDSRLALLLAVAFAWIYLAGYRWFFSRARAGRQRAVLVGSGPILEYLARQFDSGRSRYRFLAQAERVEELTDDWLTRADAVFCDAAEANSVVTRLKSLRGGQLQAELHILPNTEIASNSGFRAENIEGTLVLSLKSSADLAVMRRAKRALDIPLALLGILVTSPLWLLCILGIALTMPGPLFFQHKRRGLFGRPFGLYKFRSMVRDAHLIKVEDMSGFDDKYKLKNDPRITPFGKFMRRMSLDELPQFLNILRGELSLVGPRPIVEAELEKYGVWGGLLNTVPPGLSGLWQVSGRSDTSYQERIDFDLYYINNWSLGLDLLILLRTIPAVLSRKGAY
ncbi:exopolysaccharide biosynthesis polyprenyl glycosylphosphotransferase [bacterium]|nr:exopolysaccharide biosynthesis polyprenyl glycosylphosphotransferase [bacterium]